MFFIKILNYLTKILCHLKSKVLHHKFCCRIFSEISKNGHKYISKKSLYDFFSKIDEISLDIQEYNKRAMDSFVVEDCIPIKERMVEMHVICSSIYNIEGVHHITIDHLNNVREYTNHICFYLRENPDYTDFLDEQTVELISMAAFMHDISKLIIDDNFLYDGRKFNAEEKMFMNAHPVISFIMIEYIKHRNKHLAKYLDEINTSVIEHHENLDGTGYPSGKSYNEISLGGRVLRVADTFEAMMAHKRKYKQPLDKQRAINEMIIKSDTYEESIVRALDVFIKESFKMNKVIEKHFFVEDVKIY